VQVKRTTNNKATGTSCSPEAPKDGVNGDGGFWAYSDTVKEHFFAPKNILKDDEDFDADGIGTCGSPACGDVMMFLIKVDKDTQRISDCRWRTFGCASAIASTSTLSEMVIENGGMPIEKARLVKPQQIVERLGGLPDRKFHCSVLGHMALRSAVDDFKKRNAHE
jgi:NifU-like protein involved in Fe-S cluster formation